MYTMPVIIPDDSFCEISELSVIQKILKSDLTPKGYTVEYPKLPTVYDIDGMAGICLIRFDTPQLFTLSTDMESVNTELHKSNLDFNICTPMRPVKGKLILDPDGFLMLANAS